MNTVWILVFVWAHPVLYGGGHIDQYVAVFSDAATCEAQRAGMAFDDGPDGHWACRKAVLNAVGPTP